MPERDIGIWLIQVAETDAGQRTQHLDVALLLRERFVVRRRLAPGAR